MPFNLGKNSQFIHIIAESVILIGLTLYFISRNNKLNKSIQLTSKKLADLEDKVNRQDILINQLLRVINNLQVNTNDQQNQQNQQNNSSHISQQHFQESQQQNFEILSQNINNKNLETDSNLDNELESELAELNIDEPIDITTLEAGNSKITSENSSDNSLNNFVNNQYDDLKSKSPSITSDFSIENE